MLGHPVSSKAFWQNKDRKRRRREILIYVQFSTLCMNVELSPFIILRSWKFWAFSFDFCSFLARVVCFVFHGVLIILAQKYEAVNMQEWLYWRELKDIGHFAYFFSSPLFIRQLFMSSNSSLLLLPFACVYLQFL